MCILIRFFYLYALVTSIWSHEEDECDFKLRNSASGTKKLHQSNRSEYHRFRQNVGSYSVRFEIEGKLIQLNLTQSTRGVFSADTHIWKATSSRGPILQPTYKRALHNETDIGGDFYINNEQKAVILFHRKQVGPVLSFDGVMGEGVSRKIILSRPDTDKNKRETKDSSVIQKIPRCKNSEQNQLDSKDIAKKIKSELNKIDVELDLFYPKLLIVVDYHLFREFNEDIESTVKYIATYWNIVDQKYSSLNSPRVQIVVTGLIIETDETALSYVNKHRFGSHFIISKGMLEDVASYFAKHFGSHLDFDNSNAVFVMTGLALRKKSGEQYFLETLGLTAAKRGGICSTDRNIAIISDNGQFPSTLIAAHELGHLLNLEHDYAKECYGPLYSLPSVMSTPSNSAKVFWSECSKKALREFARSKAAKCLVSRSKL